MKLPDYVRDAMRAFPGSFINHCNELILIPKFNVYFCLDDVESKEDFLCKMCEWVSRDCCYAAHYNRMCYRNAYYQRNTEAFNKVCGTDFDIEDMEFIYQYLGNAVHHDLTVDFVISGFDLEILNDFHKMQEG